MKGMGWCWVGLLAAGSALADCAPVARIERIDGEVSVRAAAGGGARPVTSPAPLCAGDEVRTGRGRALVGAGAGDLITVDSASALVVKADDHAALSAGRALFDIQRRPVGATLSVHTRLSVIGVKGTRFLVSDRPEGVKVALDEGVVDVASTQGKLGLYREKPQVPRERSFEDFKREMREGVAAEKKAFEEYKATIRKEFVAYVERVTMKAGTELDITQGEAIERETSSDVKAELDELRRWRFQR